MESPVAGSHTSLARLWPPFLGCCRASALLGSLVLAAVLFMLLPSSAALANDTAVGGVGGNVYPLSNADIRMRAETVQAVCYRGFAEYRVEFKFVNEGPSQVVKLGFPFRVTLSDSMGNAPIAFRAWQDGEPLHVSLGRGVSQQDLMNGEQSLGYYLHEAELPPGETTITVSYFALPTVSSGSRFPQLAPSEVAALNINAWDAKYNYWVHTGAGWKGDIGKTVIRFSLADDFMGWGVDAPLSLEGARADNTTGPAPYVRVDKRTYQWVYEDYEPSEDHDVQLAFDRPNYFWFTGLAGEVPASWGAMPIMEGRRDDWWRDEKTRPAGWEAIDSDPSTAWDSTAAKGHSMQMGIAGNQKIAEVRIISGRNDALGSFGSHGRPKSLRITLSDGTAKTLALVDEQGLQRFPMSGTAEWVRVEVLDSYPGTKSEHSFISEIAFGTEPAPSFADFATLMQEQAPPAVAPPASADSEPTPITTVEDTGAVSTVPPSGSLGDPASPTLSTLAQATDVVATQVDKEDQRRTWPLYLGIAVVVMLAAGVALVIHRRRLLH